MSMCLPSTISKPLVSFGQGTTLTACRNERWDMQVVDVRPQERFPARCSQVCTASASSDGFSAISPGSSSCAALFVERVLSHQSTGCSARSAELENAHSRGPYSMVERQKGRDAVAVQLQRDWHTLDEVKLRSAVLPKMGGLQDRLANKKITFQPMESPLPGMVVKRAQSAPLRPNHVPIYVMLPLDTVTIVNTLNHVKALQAGLRALKSIGVDGVMVDVWWGIVEKDGPQKYNWSAYMALVKMVNAAGLKLQAVMSFHGCGGNVGDSFLVSLPYWVLQEAESNPDVLYTDKHGNRNGEYLSLGVDCLPLFSGRAPVQIYGDFMESFRSNFSEFLGDTIVEVSVGLGPAGELRYPSYPEGDGRWRFPGIGEFQCYDKYMLANLRACAASVGKPDWGLRGPHDSGRYNQWPEETGFFRNHNGSWNTAYGDFFLTWYSEALIAHGSRVMSVAASVFKDTGVVIAGKLPGIHWWYKSRSHAAELTAGYYNTVDRDGYSPVVKMFAKHGAVLNFTCVEMGDGEQPQETKCSPEGLLYQVRRACAKYGVPISGENALPRFDHHAHVRIKNNIHCADHPELPPMAAFTFLRMGESLFQAENWRLFVKFVQGMDRESRSNENAARALPVGDREWAVKHFPHSVDIARRQKQHAGLLQMQL
eukprot:TRINITY_DN19887_c0_g1_i1.p1 TRINITY_DN19887_c0_g1~~TRINITY_DN19887_c0_g1_i1.p1  ORF type:complete len:653 (-),score=88.43 TRINITY_DN19887_c0_g1_i1:1006-2964(-)